jgi:hypothetical protein
MSQTNISNILLYLKKLFTDGHISHHKDSVEQIAKALAEDEHLVDAFIKELLSRRLVIESMKRESKGNVLYQIYGKPTWYISKYKMLSDAIASKIDERNWDLVCRALESVVAKRTKNLIKAMLMEIIDLFPNAEAMMAGANFRDSPEAIKGDINIIRGDAGITLMRGSKKFKRSKRSKKSRKSKSKSKSKTKRSGSKSRK